MYKVSVVIPTYNRKDILKRCLDALFFQNTPATDYEVILVDDGSSDGTENMAVDFRKHINFKYYKLKNSGPATARNMGAKLANGEFILFVDDDVIAFPDLINAHLYAHEKNPETAVIGYTPFASECITNRNVAYHQQRWDNIFKKMASKEEQLPYYYFMTLNVSLSRDIFWKLGGLDESFKCANFEDTEFGYRLFESGIKLSFLKEAYALHMYNTTLLKSCQRCFKTGFSVGILIDKYLHLRDRFLVDYVNNNINKHDSKVKKIKVYTRRIISKKIILDILKYVINIFEKLFPQNLLFYLYAFIEINYYAIGFREGYKNCNKKQA